MEALPGQGRGAQPVKFLTLRHSKAKAATPRVPAPGGQDVRSLHFKWVSSHISTVSFILILQPQCLSPHLS